MKLVKYSPNKIPTPVMKKIEDFRFPSDMKNREEELKLDRQYNKRSTYVVCFKDDIVVGTLKFIEKRNKREYLPIEYSDIKPFTQYYIEEVPACEIGGLKISTALAPREKQECILRLAGAYNIFVKKFQNVYLTCEQSLEKFYRRFSFKKISDVYYKGKKYVAMEME